MDESTMTRRKAVDSDVLLCGLLHEIAETLAVNYPTALLSKWSV